MQVDNLEVWFQRASDVMRKLRAGDLDLGIVGYDMFMELGQARSALDSEPRFRHSER
jgi:ATP phosphoribosyltransferase